LASVERNLNLLIEAVETSGTLSESQRAALLLTHGAGVSVHSLRILVDKHMMGARDSFGISRSICESAVNACFLMFGDETVVAKAHRHALQKIHREKNRRATVAGVRLNVRSPLDIRVEDLPDLAAAIREYTTRSGGEKREWSGKTIDQKIDQVSNTDKGTATSLAASRLLIYGASSEVLHGSLYGIMYFWGGFSDNRSHADRRYTMMVHFLTAAVAAAFAADGLFKAWIHLKGPLPLNWNSASLFRAFKSLVFLDETDPSIKAEATFP
jgi:hypothetical protein